MCEVQTNSSNETKQSILSKTLVDIYILCTRSTQTVVFDKNFAAVHTAHGYVI